METIKGWHNVPEGWYTKTQLKELGLKPGKEQKPVGEIYVYGRREWCYLYKKEDCVAIKRLSKEHKAAILKSHEKYHCEECGRRNYQVKPVVDYFHSYLEENEKLTMLYIKEYVEKRWCPECVEWLDQQVSHKFHRIAFGKELKEKLKDGYLMLKVESTGLEYDDEIVQIAIINQNKEVLLHTYVKPTKQVSTQARWMHGKSNEDLKNEPTWTEIYPTVKEIIQNKLVYVFNEEFVWGILRGTCHRYDLPLIVADYECAMELYANFEDRDGTYVSMEHATGEEKINEALHDCLLIHKIISEMIDV